MRKSLKFGLLLGQFVAFGAWASVGAERVPGELLVKLKGEKSAQQFFAQKGLAVSLKRQVKLSYGGLFVVKVNAGDKSLESAMNDLKNLPEVEFAEPNFIYRVGAPMTANYTPRALSINDAPNDPRFGELWGILNTGSNEPGGTSRGTSGADSNATRAWELTKGSKDVKIAIIDTGIDYNHSDLKENIWTNQAELNGKPGVDDDGNGFVDDVHGYDFANNDGDPLDGHGHGSHCAGTIAAVHDNGVGVAGVMSEATLVAVKFLSDAGSGTTEDAVRAIDYATGLNVDIMSNSWGGGGFSQALKDAITRAQDKGILFVAAAGNSSTDNDTTPHYPSSYDVSNVISVAAHTAQDSLASFSCYGRRSVHVAAPGHNILSTVKNNGYAVYSGTSMATPHVSGALGLLVAKEGRLPVAEVRERLMATSEPIRAYRRKTVSGGRLNAYNLLTNTRPTRNEPDPSLWETVRLSEKFESAHPYADGQTLSREIHVEGARFIRVKVARYDLEAGYDFMKIRNQARAEIESFSGVGTAYVTDYMEGDTAVVEFTSDSSVNKWGFLIEEVEVIR